MTESLTCSASDLEGLNFKFCFWRAASSHSSHHLQVLLAQFSLYVHKSGQKPDSFHFSFNWLEDIHACYTLSSNMICYLDLCSPRRWASIGPTFPYIILFHIYIYGTIGLWHEKWSNSIKLCYGCNHCKYIHQIQTKTDWKWTWAYIRAKCHFLASLNQRKKVKITYKNAYTDNQYITSFKLLYSFAFTGLDACRFNYYNIFY